MCSIDEEQAEMLRLLLLFLLSLLERSAGSAAQTPRQVFAVVGEAVILPCSLWNRTLFDDSPTVEWTRADLKPKAALVYRHNGEVFEMKHQRFEFRTSLFHREVKDGNVSLRISDVQLSDAGMFYCLKIPKEYPKVQMENSTVELVVVSVSDLKISMVSVESGAVFMECQASCWRPKPEMKILDDQGRTLNSIKTQTQEPSGCFNVRQKVVLENSTGRFTCRAELLQSNQTRSTQILITAVFLWKTYHIVLVCVVDALLFLAGFALWQLFGGRSHRLEPPVLNHRKMSNGSTTSSVSDRYLSPGKQTWESKEGSRQTERDEPKDGRLSPGLKPHSDGPES